MAVAAPTPLAKAMSLRGFAKQSPPQPKKDCFVGSLLAMTKILAKAMSSPISMPPCGFVPRSHIAPIENRLRAEYGFPKAELVTFFRSFRGIVYV
jgi:hypothetical protein